MRTKLLVLVALLTMSATALAGNLGHRLGGDDIKHLPENSLAVMDAAIYGVDGVNGGEPLMDHSSFSYFEFDVQETWDNQLAIFHDKDFKRMIPYEGRNVEIYEQVIQNVYERTGKKYSYKKLTVRLVTLEELQSFYLKGEGDHHVPTLADVLNYAADHRVTKPMVVEVKRLISDGGRDETLGLMKKFKEEYGDQADMVYTKKYDYPGNLSVTFLAFPKKFKYSFPTTELKNKYCDMLRDYGLGGMWKAGSHSKDQCANYGEGKAKLKKTSWWKFWR